MIFSSPFPDVPIPADKGSWSYLELHAHDENAHKPAFVCAVTRREVTFAQAHAQAKQIVAGLHARGIQKHDVVVLHSFNCIEYPIVFLALNRLGAICSSSPPMLDATGLSVQVKTAGAKAIIAHKTLAQAALDAAQLAQVPTNQVYTIADADSLEALPAQSIEELMAEDLPFPKLPPLNPNDVVFLPFSSGTTGRPKGVQLTGRGMHAVDLEFSSIAPVGPYSLGLAPFFRTGVIIFHLSVYSGTATVVMPHFEPELFLSVLETYKLEAIIVPPPLILFLANDSRVEKYDLSHLKVIACGGAPLKLEAERIAEKRLNVTITQGYGCTELAGAATFSTPFTKRHGSTGVLVPNARLKVVSLTTGEELLRNEPGELLFSTPSVTPGYWRYPEANETLFDADGFLRSGDYGYIDDDGFVFVVDRIKEFIKYEGHQVAPAELEEVLEKHPLVADSCCVRGHDEESGEEVPKAYVVLQKGESGGEVLKQELMRFVNDQVAPYKHIREVEFTDQIPRNPTGKTLRRELQLLENEKVARAKQQAAIA
uniref:AMP-dependent synthetase/ligase domain-containing protein n=1 Tax=Globisporangium ultimum (strain ATCC 200006 / CBS 805.95 / DAOM BR144) TaxID=431595 RepID=K3XAT7_GLOUD